MEVLILQHCWPAAAALRLYCHEYSQKAEEGVTKAVRFRETCTSKQHTADQQGAIQGFHFQSLLIFGSDCYT
jgi:hypothetical protein